MVDLHSHSKYSDGSMSPEELINHAELNSIKALALTDHDSIDGLNDFMSTKSAIEKICGVEISIGHDNGTFHMVGLFLDINDEYLAKSLKTLAEYRRERNIEILSKMENLIGRNISIDEISSDNYGELGRPHMAKFLIKEGVVSSISEAFDIYLGKGKQLYLPKKRLVAEDAVKMIKSAGGLAVVAHPITLNLTDDEYMPFFKHLKDIGVDGIEVYCSLHDDGKVNFYKKISDKFSFAISIGSDFHGTNKPDVFIGKSGCSDKQSHIFLDELKKLL